VMHATAGCPQFKTQRRLGSRAIVSDTFQKDQDLYGTVPKPGDGLVGHKDGYNVLYGDYSTHWFGDQEQRIIYWDTSTGVSYGNSYPIGFQRPIFVEYYAGKGSFYAPRNVVGGAGGPGNSGYKETSSYAVWHQFDLAHELDRMDYPGTQHFP